MDKILLSKGTAKNKKLKAQFVDKQGHVTKTIQFGDNRYEDYTTHHDDERKKRYLQRHQHDPRTITTAGGLARDILWNKTSLTASVADTQRKHPYTKIVLKK